MSRLDRDRWCAEISAKFPYHVDVVPPPMGYSRSEEEEIGQFLESRIGTFDLFGAIANGAQQGDPVQHLARGVAGCPQPLARGLVQQRVDIAPLEAVDHLLRPRLVGRPEVAAREGRYESEGWRVRKDGTRFWANAILDPVRDADGRLIGYAKITRDISDKKEAEQALF